MHRSHVDRDCDDRVIAEPVFAGVKTAERIRVEVKTFGLKRGAVLFVIALWVTGIAATGSHRQADPQAAQPSQPGTGVTGGFSHVVDLTHTLTAEFPYIPVPGITFPFRSTPIATIDKRGWPRTVGISMNTWARKSTRRRTSSQVELPSIKYRREH